MVMAQLFLATMWLQQGETISTGNSTLLMIFIGIVALGSLVQTVVLVAMGIGAAKARKEVLGILHEVRGKAMPLIQNTQEIVKDLTPKIKSISENLVESTQTVRNKVTEIDATITDVNGKTRAQVDRVNGMVTSTLNATADLAASVHHGIRVPVREVVGVVNGLKAGLDVLVGRTTRFDSDGRPRNGDLRF
jgi:methyl-accepting chemotaxis protein